MGKRKLDADRLGAVLVSAVTLAEELFGPKSGAKKKAFVVELVNSKVDIPWISERGEARILSAMIDVICALVMRRVF